MSGALALMAPSRRAMPPKNGTDGAPTMRRRRDTTGRTAMPSTAGSTMPNPRLATSAAGPLAGRCSPPSISTRIAALNSGVTRSTICGSKPNGSTGYRPSKCRRSVVRERERPRDVVDVEPIAIGNGQVHAAATSGPRTRRHLETSGPPDLRLASCDRLAARRDRDHVGPLEELAQHGLRGHEMRGRARRPRGHPRRCGRGAAARSRAARSRRPRARRLAAPSHIGPTTGSGTRPPRRTACHGVAAPGPTTLSGPS